jgi:hypothetical protein
MPPKLTTNPNIKDSSTYPSILPLWRKANVRLTRATFGMQDPDPTPLMDSGQYYPWWDRMQPALQLAIRAIICSSSFHVRVLCADQIALEGTPCRYLNPDFMPTSAHCRQYRDMINDLSANIVSTSTSITLKALRVLHTQ